MSAHDIKRETEAAKLLLASLRDIGHGDDDELIVDAIEGETNLLEVIDNALLQIASDEAGIEALAEVEKKIAARKERFKRRVDLSKAALLVALQVIEKRKIERPLATISVRAVAPNAIITDETLIPREFWKIPDPKIDKKALLAAMKDDSIPGAELSNGGETIAVRFA